MEVMKFLRIMNTHTCMREPAAVERDMGCQLFHTVAGLLLHMFYVALNSGIIGTITTTYITVMESSNYPIVLLTTLLLEVTSHLELSSGRGRQHTSGRLLVPPPPHPPRTSWHALCMPLHVGAGGTTSRRWVGCATR